MNGLDAKTARIFREILFEYRREGKVIVFSTHVLQLAGIICDRVGVLHKGTMIAEGRIEDLKEKLREESLEDVFLKLTAEENVFEAVREL